MRMRQLWQRVITACWAVRKFDGIMLAAVDWTLPRILAAMGPAAHLVQEAVLLLVGCRKCVLREVDVQAFADLGVAVDLWKVQGWLVSTKTCILSRNMLIAACKSVSSVSSDWQVYCEIYRTSSRPRVARTTVLSSDTDAMTASSWAAMALCSVPDTRCRHDMPLSKWRNPKQCMSREKRASISFAPRRLVSQETRCLSTPCRIWCSMSGAIDS